MLVFWLLFDKQNDKKEKNEKNEENIPTEKSIGDKGDQMKGGDKSRKGSMGVIDREVYSMLQLVHHTIVAKSILYFSITLFFLISLFSLLSSVIICGAAHVFWFLSRMHLLEATLSTEACDALETELILSEMKTGRHIQSDWHSVEVRTDCGLHCSMNLHSLIYTGEDNIPENIPENTENAAEGIPNQYPDSCENENSGHHSSSNSSRSSSSSNSSSNSSSSSSSNSSQKCSWKEKGTDAGTEQKKKKKKDVLLWLHGAGGTATLSFGLSGVIDRLGGEYDIYALDLPGFGRSKILWDGSTEMENVSGTAC